MSFINTYIAAAEDVAPTADKKSWWKRNEEVLPNCSSTCKSVLLVQPSSATAERVFSILFITLLLIGKNINSLKDYIETSVMLQCNCR